MSDPETNTEQAHPRASLFEGKSPLEVAGAVGRRIVNLTNPKARSMLWAARLDPFNQAYIDGALAEIADSVDQFVQIGAHNGEFDDPFKELIPRFKHALLVEPQADLVAQLEERYATSPNVTVRRMAVAPEAGVITIYRSVGKKDEFGSAIASVDPYHVKAEVTRCLGLTARFKTRLETEEVPAVTMAELVQSELDSPDDLTLLASDTEGCDEYVVRGVVDDLGLRPPVIHYEHVHLARAAADALARDLNSMGYSLRSTHKDTLAMLPS